MATTAAVIAVHTDDLMTINRESVRRQFNRTLSSKLIEALDPDGINLVEWHMGQDDIVRVLLQLKLTDRDEAANGWLDMTYARFNALPRLEKHDGQWVRAETPA